MRLNIWRRGRSWRRWKSRCLTICKRRKAFWTQNPKLNSLRPFTLKCSIGKTTKGSRTTNSKKNHIYQKPSDATSAKKSRSSQTANTANTRCSSMRERAFPAVKTKKSSICCTRRPKKTLKKWGNTRSLSLATLRLIHLATWSRSKKWRINSVRLDDQSKWL